LFLKNEKTKKSKTHREKKEFHFSLFLSVTKKRKDELDWKPIFFLQ
jgi:hypothetical protein